MCLAGAKKTWCVQEVLFLVGGIKCILKCILFLKSRVQLLENMVCPVLVLAGRGGGGD